jgi:BirA family transcriptional regulator, biotin operon repressor / biotin---[acetyl-CoA-carboxylase] ligase
MSGGRFTDVRHLDEVDSTNRYAMDCAVGGAPEGLVVLADYQTAGRGRLDRRWESPPGASLLVSVLLRPPLVTSELQMATVSVALAAVAACEATAGVSPLVKWPNDLVVEDSKLAGVLAEVVPPGPVPGENGGHRLASHPARPPRQQANPDPPSQQPRGAERAAGVVVGIGVNLRWPGPPGAGGTSLLELGADVPAGRLLHSLLDELEPRRVLLDDARGRRTLTAALRERCATLGRRVSVQLTDGRLEGEAVDITDAGHLVLRGPTGRQEVASGDVVHLRRGSQGSAGDVLC